MVPPPLCLFPPRASEFRARGIVRPWNPESESAESAESAWHPSSCSCHRSESLPGGGSPCPQRRGQSCGSSEHRKKHAPAPAIGAMGMFLLQPGRCAWTRSEAPTWVIAISQYSKGLIHLNWWRLLSIHSLSLKKKTRSKGPTRLGGSLVAASFQSSKQFLPSSSPN